MRRCLLVFAKLNPGLRYVQGMNELLAPLYFHFRTDPAPGAAGHAEADAFFCFMDLLAEFRDHFCQQLVRAGAQGRVGFGFQGSTPVGWGASVPAGRVPGPLLPASGARARRVGLGSFSWALHLCLRFQLAGWWFSGSAVPVPAGARALGGGAQHSFLCGVESWSACGGGLAGLACLRPALRTQPQVPGGVHRHPTAISESVACTEAKAETPARHRRGAARRPLALCAGLGTPPRLSACARWRQDNSAVGIRATLTRLSELLRRVDPALWAHLVEENKAWPCSHACPPPLSARRLARSSARAVPGGARRVLLSDVRARHAAAASGRVCGRSCSQGEFFGAPAAKGRDRQVEG